MRPLFSAVIMVFAAVASSAVLPSALSAQTAAVTDIPAAPVGHRQPTAGAVPHGDSVAGVPDKNAAGSPALITPQEQRDNTISGSLCKTPTC